MIQHEITSVDACVTVDEGIAVMVVGRLKVCAFLGNMLSGAEC